VRGRLLANRLNHGQLTVREVLSNKFSNIQPLQFMKVDRSEYRLNIVTDSLRGDSLLGGVATALILAVQYCNKENIPLRIITRTAETNPLDFDNFLKMMELKKPIGVEYYTDYDRYLKRNHHKLEVSEKDIFIATSWWSAHNIQSINLRKHFFYILQEVEPLFYPNSDEQLLCEEVLNNRDIKFIINSKLLYDYYDNNNYVNVAKNGVYFEPAFIKKLYSASEASFKEKKKYNLLFYSRPKKSKKLVLQRLGYY
jgi:hypothetical protein